MYSTLRRGCCPLHEKWRHPQNQKYLTYRNTAIGGPSHGHRQHAQEIWLSLVMWFQKQLNRSRCRQFGVLTCEGPRKNAINWGTYGRHLANRIKRSVLGGDMGHRNHYSINLFIITSAPPREGCEVMWWVCLFVYLTVRVSARITRKSYGRTFTCFYVYVAYTVAISVFFILRLHKILNGINDVVFFKMVVDVTAFLNF